jgi:hypothetical protein
MAEEVEQEHAPLGQQGVPSGTDELDGARPGEAVDADEGRAIPGQILIPEEGI